MKPGRPSRTAMGAAGHRAVHQIVEGGRIFADPIAVRILGADADVAIGEAENDPSRRRMRMVIAVRSRFAEDALADAIAGGASQLVILGAGLDTYAYRTTFGDRVRILEVDHPATQAWKRDRLAAAGIAEPGWLTFAPIDFEHESLADALAAVGFDVAQHSFFTWLGVVPYLTEKAVFSTLGFIAGLPGKAQVVFDYRNPPDADSASDERAADRAALAARVAAVGEAFKSQFETDLLHARMTAMGLRVIEDLGPAAIRERYFANRSGAASDRGGHIVRATTT